MRATVLTGVICGLLLAGGAAAASFALRADSPIVGLWGRSDGRQVRVSAGSGVIAVSPNRCLPVGKQVWRIGGAGPSYSGSMLWYSTADCATTGWGKATWKVDSDTLTHCTWAVDGSDTGCVTYTRIGAAAPGTTTTAGAAVPDTKRPEARALDYAGRAQPGSRIALHFRMKDDSGKATARIVLYQGGLKVGEFRSPAPESATMISTGHSLTIPLAPSLVGPLYYCLEAIDAAGNKSAGQCAWITLVAPLAKVSNGCGGAGWAAWVASQNYLLNTSSYRDPGTGTTYTVDFKQACNLHDAGYGGFAVADPIAGGVVDFRSWSRGRVDDKFLRDMQTLCRRSIPAAAKTALASCLGNGGGASIGAKSRYDVVHKVGYRFFDADLKRPEQQQHGSRPNI